MNETIKDLISYYRAEFGLRYHHPDVSSDEDIIEDALMCYRQHFSLLRLIDQYRVEAERLYFVDDTLDCHDYYEISEADNISIIERALFLLIADVMIKREHLESERNLCKGCPRYE